MYHLCTDENLNSVEAYEKLGFPIDELGRNRACQTLKYAKKLNRKGKLDPIRCYGYDGSVPPEQMDLKNMTVDQQAAYYRTRNAFLEIYVEYLKKKILR